MEVSFYGVRGSIPAPGPSTVRYGGNTSCVLVRLQDNTLVILDCGTGMRNLGLALQAGECGRGQGAATFLLSHAHWDHIQGFPFFVPFYTPGNHFTIYGQADSPAALEAVLEGQMAAQYFPVQSIKNMNAAIEMRLAPVGDSFAIGRSTVRAARNPHGNTSALAFRIEDGQRVVVFAGDAGYGPQGPSPEALALYQGADLLIHDCSFTPEDRAGRIDRGLSSLDDALDAAVRARVKRLALFHYDQDYSDHDVDQLIQRGRRRLAEQPGAGDIEVLGAAEGLTLTL
jgi:phosphoribosyl 1,2-cyclic phosphodiesterase